MDTTTSIKPKTMAELLPGLCGILSKDSIQTLTDKKQPRQTIAQTRSTGKMIKPLTIAEMRAGILALKVQSPRRVAQAATTTKKRTWNTSVKVDSKIVSRTANGQMNNNPVRKVLNFQPKPKAVSNLRGAMAQDSPKYPKSEFRAKKLYLQGRNNVRISGISNIAETPLVNIPKRTQRSEMSLANKENLPNRSIKKTALPKIPYHNKLITAVPDTPLSNESWQSSCDASFLQKEKEINDVEEKLKEFAEEKTLENITDITPPASTPFKEYRSVQEFFHNSIDADNSTMCHDNTIMCFDNHAGYKDNAREESVISLCDLLNKASVNNSRKKNNTQKNLSQKIRPQSAVDHLLQMVNQTEHYIKLTENSIAALNKMKESQVIHLESLKRMIKDKECLAKSITAVQVTPNAAKGVNPENYLNSRSKQSRENSVIKSAVRSPSYKVPKKNFCLRKKMLCKLKQTWGTVNEKERTHEFLNYPSVNALPESTRHASSDIKYFTKAA